VTQVAIHEKETVLAKFGPLGRRSGVRHRRIERLGEEREVAQPVHVDVVLVDTWRSSSPRRWFRGTT
jgi:hypothetical protein